MKIINTTIGRNPPVVRMNSFVQKVVCYQLVSTTCEDWDESSEAIRFLPNIPNESRANTKPFRIQDVPNNKEMYHDVSGYSPLLLNRQRTNRTQDYEQRVIERTFPPDTAVYRIYTEKELLVEDYVPIAKENKFKILVPSLPVGFYYLDVWAKGGFNKVMLNVS